MWEFRVFSHVYENVISYYFVIFRSLHVWKNQHETKTETENPHFCRFCLKMSVFVANKTLIFSDL